ncbi:MAG: alpha/beta fold hydrolase [Rhodocyclales bacterium]|nr:alpha/beta fold hydrolase [Rhodocyclales bacterium]
MEMRLPLFFSPRISTTVRFIIGLAGQRLAFRVLAPLSPRKAGDRARRLFLTPPRHRFRDAELAALEEATPFTVSMPTGRLIGWRWGRRKDPPVVLVHGWGGRAAQLRGYVAPLVARGYSVVAFDAPGHGMTGGRESSVVHMAAALDAVLRDVGPVEAVIGHSLGGAVTGYVLSRGAPVKKAVLLAPPASLTDYSHRFARLLRLPEGVRALMQAQIERRFGIRWSDFEVEATAPKLTQPALIVHDVDDRDNPFRDGERYARHWPGARLVATQGLGHRGALHDAAVIHEVAGFIGSAP